MKDWQSSSSPESKPLRPLLPKLAKRWKPLNRLRRNQISGCYVSICLRKNCSLISHHQSRPRMGKNTALPVQRQVSPGRELVPVFSFADPQVNDDEFKNLFHQYLSFDMPRIVALMAPPSSVQSPTDAIKTRAQGIANLGLMAPVYFLLFVSMAHILELVRREQLEPDRVSAKIYGRLMRVLREKLNNYTPSEAPDLVLAVLALSSFDMTLGQHAAVDHHRTALQQLVSHVGLHALGRSTAYVLSWDRLIAAYTAKPPLYAKVPDPQFLRPPRHRIRYGLGFDMYENQLDLDPQVRRLCGNVCRAIEIVEAENWTFRPERLYKPYTVADVQYLYFLRDFIQNTCIVLQAKPLHNASKSKPILLAAMIIQYIVLGKNDLTWYSTCAADRLYAELVQQDLGAEWENCEDVLCWLMCLLTTVPRPWKWRPMALELFRDWLRDRSEITETGTPPEPWSGTCSPEDFMWCKPEFDDELSKTLRDIQKSASPERPVRIRRVSISDSHVVVLGKQQDAMVYMDSPRKESSLQTVPNTSKPGLSSVHVN